MSKSNQPSGGAWAAMADTFTEEYLSQRLFHLWQHSSPQKTFSIFKSICKKGLLLSRATKDLIDRFHYRRRDGRVDWFEVVQSPRVCFTDIPEDKLGAVTQMYGRFAVGFSRSDILEWGGLPVWYLPNHRVPGALTDHGASLVYWLYRTAQIASFVLPRLIPTTGTKVTLGEEDFIDASNVDWYAKSMMEAAKGMGCFLKEMSSKSTDDHRYLYEREWRVVGGCTSDEFGDPCRKLEDAEKTELLKQRPEWSMPMESLDLRITAQFSGERLIDSFRLFNGIPGRKTVCQAIEVVLVPDERFRDQVLRYVDVNGSRFRDGGPEVKIAPSAQGQGK